MANWTTPSALLGSLMLALTGLAAPATSHADPAALTLHGLVERLPDTPDSRGEWRIGGHTLIVSPQTRLEERGAAAGGTGYWTQATTGVVVWAPGWPSDVAHAAGFRSAVRAEVGGIALGRPVKATVRPADGGTFDAIEIELRDTPRGHTAR